MAKTLIDWEDLYIPPDNILIGANGANLAITPDQLMSLYEITPVVAASYNILSTDQYIHVNRSGNVNLFLPEISSIGKKIYFIRDTGLNSSKYRIRISATGENDILIFDKESFYVDIKSNGSSITLYNDGLTKWFTR